MIKEKIIESIKQCYDPEIPVDLWNLGLIYSINHELNKSNKYTVDITMTLTTPKCNMADHIAEDLKRKVLKNQDISKVIVNITFDPEWEPNMMTEKAKEILGLTNNNNNNWE
jgi:metal-sulfur cluster biosynthetic enzyme